MRVASRSSASGQHCYRWRPCPAAATCDTRLQKIVSTEHTGRNPLDNAKLQKLQLEDKAEARQNKQQANAERKRRANLVIDATDAMQIPGKARYGCTFDFLLS